MRYLVMALAICTAAAVPARAQTPSVEDLLAKNLESRGGTGRLTSIDTRRVSGTFSAQGMQMTMTVTSKRPNLMLQEMHMGDRRIVTAFDGEQAWTINPMFGDKPQALQGVQAALIRDQAYFDGPLALAKSRGDKMEVTGQEDVEGTPTWKLAITHEGHVTTINLDAKTGLERKLAMTVSDGGMNLEIETLVSDYQPTDGIMVPHTVRTTIGGQPPVSVNIEKVEFNVPVDDSAFRMPQMQ